MRIARLSSARRRARGRPPLGGWLALAAAIALVATVTVLELTRRSQPQEAEDAAPAAPTATAPAVPMLPSPTPTPTATAPVRSSSWVELTAPEPTPTLIPTVRSLPPRRRPSATPIRDCVKIRWTAHQALIGSAHVVVEIDALNRCPRDLQPTELAFTIQGYREGAVVQSVRGFPFQSVRRGFSEPVTIGLPGSIDWYDTITVTLATPYGTSTSEWRQR